MSLENFTRISRYGDIALDPGVEPVAIPLTGNTLTGLRCLPVASPDSEDPTDRPVVLILPGYTGSKEDFRMLLPLLAHLGWRVLAISRRGQGDSSGSRDPADYTLAAEAEDVIEVLDLLGSQAASVHLLGHSLGGVIARAATLRAPERVDSLTMLCSGPHGWAYRKIKEQTLASGPGVEALWAADNPRWHGIPAEQMDPEARFLYQRLIDTGAGSIIGGARILESPEDTTEQLREMSVPVHIARGETDEHWPSSWQEDMAQRLGARYSVIPQADHSPNVENPQGCAEVLNAFWRSLPLTSRPGAGSQP